MNRLQQERSPYLQAAAHQPVQWEPWGEQAFARARAEDKPILLDIGAAWCHWCHVIDRESYDNPEIARLINELFVPVKVDRDEMPDVDARYQTAVSAISGQGGWPLTAFLTPDGRPFYGGTYFPPEDALGRPGFRRVLLAVAEAWRNRRAEIERTAEAVAEAVARAERMEEGPGPVQAGLLDGLLEAALGSFDPRHGGFGQAPKFPHPTAIDLLLQGYRRSGRGELLTAAAFTLERMAAGGVYDQLGGGFHRYAVDERWQVPHFEKMCSDNAELLRAYLHGYQMTGEERFREVAEGILGWAAAVLADPEQGGFAASQDADVAPGDDGSYYTWTQEEVRQVLPPDEARLVELYFDVGPVGEMHHDPARNVLWVARTPAAVAEQLGISGDEFRERLERARARLLAARAARPTPAVDRTVYTAWNGLMVSAWLEAARVLNRPDCRAFALRTLERLLAQAWSAERGFARWPGEPQRPGLLEDQVYGALALLDAFEETLEPRYFAAARGTAELLLKSFFDSGAGGFFDRPHGQAGPVGFAVERKPFQDAPAPSANAAAVVLLERLHALTGEDRFRQAAEKTLAAFASLAPRYGIFAAGYGLALDLHLHGPLEVLVTGASDDLAAWELWREAAGFFCYGKSLYRLTAERAGAELPPVLAATARGLELERPAAVVCAGRQCFPPVGSADELRKLLERVTGSSAESS
jgi:uncharacterized protein YyaL (SSP411 family)